MALGVRLSRRHPNHRGSRSGRFHAQRAAVRNVVSKELVVLAQVHERGLGVVQLDRGGLFGDTLERSCRYAGLAQQMQRLIVA